jgi:hypothetical protein
MVRKDRSSFSVVHESAGTAIVQVMSAKRDDEVAVNGSNTHRLATGADDVRDEPDKRAYSSPGSQRKGGGCLITGLTIRKVPRGRPPSPWLGRRPRRAPGGDEGFHPGEAARPGAGGPTLDRAAVIKPSPNQTLLPLGGTFRGDGCHSRRTMRPTARNLPRSPCRTGPANQVQPQIVLFLGMRQVHDCLGPSNILVICQITNGPDPKRLLQGVSVAAGQTQGRQRSVDQRSELHRPRLAVRERGGLGPVGQG